MSIALLGLGCRPELVGEGESAIPTSTDAGGTAPTPEPSSTTGADDGTGTTVSSPSDGGGPGTSSGGDPTPPTADDPRAQVIYLVMTDRFFNGDSSNDMAGVSGCFDPEHERRFHGGDLQGLVERLDYLEELGVTTVWVTPVQAQIGDHFGSCGYHGYWIDATRPDDHRIEPKLGTEEDLERLVEELHARDMRLVLDMVVNHVGYGAQLTYQEPGWFHPRNGCEQLGDPEIYCDLAGLPDLAQEQPEVAEYLADQVRWWLDRYEFDGIRMDTVKHVEPAFFADVWIPAVRERRPETFLVAEALVEGTLDPLETYLETGFDSMFNFPLRRGLVQSFAGDESVDPTARWVQDTVERFGIEQAASMTNLLDNHDVVRFVSELPGQDEAARLQRYHLALTTLFTIPGIPQLYYGNELAMEGGGDPDNRRDMPTWAFSAQGRSERHPGFLGIPEQTHALVRDLARMRREHEALWKGEYAELWRQNVEEHPDVFAFYRGTDAERIIVVINAESEPSTLDLSVLDHPRIPQSHKQAMTGAIAFDDLLGEVESVSMQDGRLTVTVPARSAAVLFATR